MCVVMRCPSCNVVYKDAHNIVNIVINNVCLECEKYTDTWEDEGGYIPGRD